MASESGLQNCDLKARLALRVLGLGFEGFAMSALVLGWLGLEFRVLKSWRSQWFVQCKLEIVKGVFKVAWLPVTSLRRSQVLGKFPNSIHVALLELCNLCELTLTYPTKS